MRNCGRQSFYDANCFYLLVNTSIRKRSYYGKEESFGQRF